MNDQKMAELAIWLLYQAWGESSSDQLVIDTCRKYEDDCFSDAPDLAKGSEICCMVMGEELKLWYDNQGLPLELDEKYFHLTNSSMDSDLFDLIEEKCVASFTEYGLPFKPGIKVAK